MTTLSRPLCFPNAGMQEAVRPRHELNGAEPEKL